MSGGRVEAVRPRLGPFSLVELGRAANQNALWAILARQMHMEFNDPVRITFEVISCLLSFFFGKKHEKRRGR